MQSLFLGHSPEFWAVGLDSTPKKKKKKDENNENHQSINRKWYIMLKSVQWIVLLHWTMVYK